MWNPFTIELIKLQQTHRHIGNFQTRGRLPVIDVSQEVPTTG